MELPSLADESGDSGHLLVVQNWWSAWRPSGAVGLLDLSSHTLRVYAEELACVVGRDAWEGSEVDALGAERWEGLVGRVCEGLLQGTADVLRDGRMVNKIVNVTLSNITKRQRQTQFCVNRPRRKFVKKSDII